MSLLNRPDLLLRLEGCSELVACCAAYSHFFPGRWSLFALLFLAPDIGLLGYLTPAKTLAAAFYNSLHNTVVPIGLALFAYVGNSPLAGQIALIWMAHIGFDRMLGYGLKYPAEFRRTHIQALFAGSSV